MAGYVAALLTAFYAFRMVFRVFHGDAVAEAEELEAGHLAHGEPANPANGEREDTEVGFPGPEHHVAERSPPMKAAMGPLAVLAIFAGVLHPRRDRHARALPGAHVRQTRSYTTPSPPTGAEWSGLALGGVLAILGIAGAFFVFVAGPGAAHARARALPGRA